MIILNYAKILIFNSKVSHFNLLRAYPIIGNSEISANIWRNDVKNNFKGLAPVLFWNLLFMRLSWK